MQTQGSLQEANLASLLQTMQSERATGTLTLQNGADTSNLFFLFGHLFHATSASGQGEPVVLDALHWTQGSFTFDPRAKLPAEETIKASPADLIAQVEPGAMAMAAAPAPADTAYHTATPEAPPEAPPNEPGGTPWATPEAAVADLENPSYTSTWGTPPPDNSWQIPAPGEVETPAPDLAAAPTAWDATPAAEPAADWSTEVVATTPEATPVDPWQAGNTWTEPTPIYTPEVTTPAPVYEAPAPAATTPSSEIQIPMYPLSAGKALYKGLKSDFVDFAKLLRTLRTDAHTGYVRLTGDGYTGILLFHGGHLYETMSTETQPLLGEAGFLQFRRHMENGNGLLDVVNLDPDMVSALARVFTGSPAQIGLLGRFVNFDALLEYLTEEKLTGSVVVAGDSETGVILLQQGNLIGAYTENANALSTKADPVAALAKEPGAKIEIKTSAGDVFPIDVDGALAKSF